MESCGNVVRVKEEPSDTWSNAGDNYVSDLVDSCKVENVEKLPFHESLAIYTNEDMKVQKKLDEKISIEFECKYVKPELKPLSASICKSEYQSRLPIVKVEDEYQSHEINDRKKSFECEICHKSFGRKENLKTHINAVHDRKKPFVCDICHKSFGRKSALKTHVNLVYYRSKPYDCDICHKLFVCKAHLKTHINSVHVTFATNHLQERVLSKIT